MFKFLWCQCLITVSKVIHNFINIVNVSSPYDQAASKWLQPLLQSHELRCQERSTALEGRISPVKSELPYLVVWV